MEKYAIGILGIIGMMLIWTVVQRAWKKAFPDHHINEDVLAGRSDCGSCGCTTKCINKNSELRNKG
ncbi:hypothetical protein [Fulvivirga lutimaris]|uniref:hypothetical protein n=1 Tax=Fulvivirga lutimaris TaxID=1819566 RepID=UPI0012BD1D8E|nr:hypothetical protein [Fulvivirga lutimaris]MTI41660.1 hypothetical protein [Fulvivirga lutimaris]